MSTISSYEPANTYDLPAEVTAGKHVELSHGNMQFKTNVNGMVIPYQTLVCRYHNILTPYIKEVTLDDNDYAKYYQKPKLLSMDYYGTPELWSGILYINNMVSVANFTKKTIKLFTSSIIEVFEEIMTIYNDDLTNNKKEAYANFDE